MSNALEAQKLAVKFFVRPLSPMGEPVDGEAFVPVFHQWIQQHALPDHLLIDVAAYQHVKEGPGVLLVAHEANISADYDAGKLGLLYFRKQPLAGDFVQRLGVVLGYAQQCAKVLEAAMAGKISFDFNHFRLRIHDRLLAPNDAETLAALRPAVEAAASQFWNAAPKLESTGAANEMLTIQVVKS